MATKRSFSSPLLLITAAIMLSSVQSLAPSADNSTLTFIRTSCNSTLYPSLCFASLSPYGYVVGDSPVRLAHLAANVTRGRVRAAAIHVSALRRSPPGRMSPREAMALRDCKETLGDAVGLAWKTANELGQIDRSPYGPGTAWRVFNAQTWMSAAMTNEDTCTDGFNAVGSSSPMKADVCGQVGRTKQHTSIALALVNCLIAS